jgi:hypothetical protein
MLVFVRVMPPKMRSSSSQNRRRNCRPILTAGAYGTPAIAARISAEKSAGMSRSTAGGIVQMHRSPSACRSVPSRSA